MLTETITRLVKKCTEELTCTLQTTWTSLACVLIVFTITGCPPEPVQLPVLSTLSASEIHSTSVKSGGNITDDGVADSHTPEHSDPPEWCDYCRRGGHTG